ncbi:hypothetical protein BS78_01G468600 [Paspalum vaginatum]|nr:hypothetical protein BS78_01G468600 [Paspalum vaginatum]
MMGSVPPLFDAMPLDVTWDEELKYLLVQHDLLKQIAEGRDSLLGEERQPIATSITKGMLDTPSFVLEFGMDAACEVFNQMHHEDDTTIPPESVEFVDPMPTQIVWDEDISTELDMNNSLMQQITWSEGFSDGAHTNLIVGQTTDNVITHVDGLSPSLELRVVDVIEEFTEMPQKPVVWDEEMPSVLDTHDGLLRQLAVGREYMAGEQSRSVSEITIDMVLTQNDVSPFLMVIGVDKSAGLDIYMGLLQQLTLGEEYMKIPMVSDEILAGIGAQEGLLKQLILAWSHGFFSPGENEQHLELYRMLKRQWDPGILSPMLIHTKTVLIIDSFRRNEYDIQFLVRLPGECLFIIIV